MDPDAHVITFKRALQANGETKDTEIINLFGPTLKKGPQKWYDEFLRSNPYSTWAELHLTFCQQNRKEQIDEQISVAIKQPKMKRTKKVKEFYEQFMDLIDNLLGPPRAGFMMMSFQMKLTDSLQYTLSSHEFSRFDDLVNP